MHSSHVDGTILQPSTPGIQAAAAACGGVPVVWQLVQFCQVGHDGCTLRQAQVTINKEGHLQCSSARDAHMAQCKCTCSCKM